MIDFVQSPAAALARAADFLVGGLVLWMALGALLMLCALLGALIATLLAWISDLRHQARSASTPDTGAGGS
jgi:hypothetical protein